MMKTIHKIFLIFISVSLFYSCENFMDIHKEFLKDGEIIYAPKPDSVSFIAGKGQILFQGWMYNAVNVEKLVVSWNNGKDSVNIPVSLNTGMDSIEMMLTNMPEKSYTFNVYSVDNFGHHSLVVTNFGSSYGDIYTSSLIDRRIKSIGLTDKVGTVSWFSAPEGLVYSEIRYTQFDGSVSVSRTAASDFTTTLSPRPVSASEFEYRSLFIPEAQSIDTFYTAWTKYPDPFPSTYLYDRSSWTVLQVSDETASDGGGMNTLIDNDLVTYWHSKWDPTTPLPHWAIIDMSSPKKIAYLEIYRRRGNTDTKTVQILASDSSDPNSGTWVKIGEGVYTSGDMLTINSTSTFQGRYLKIYLPDSNRDPFTSIAEIYVYGN